MKPGTRIELDFCSDEYTVLKPGDKGTVMHDDALGTLHVEWDNGSHLGLIPGVDSWHVIEDGE